MMNCYVVIAEVGTMPVSGKLEQRKQLWLQDPCTFSEGELQETEGSRVVPLESVKKCSASWSMSRS